MNQAAEPEHDGDHQTPPPTVPSDVATETTEESGSYRFPWWLLPGALFFWVVASVFGAVSIALPTLPQEAVLTLDGSQVDSCSSIAPELMPDPGAALHYCTSQEYLGAALPDDVEYDSTGRIAWDAVGWDELLRMATVPEVWFTISLGVLAMLFLIGFSKATSTVRAGLATSVSVVFFGLLLFPQYFTARIPGDMRGELINAWQLVLVFYFGSEGTVQALKVLRPGAAAAGDMEASGVRRRTVTARSSPVA